MYYRMTLEQITAFDITGWDCLEDIADSFEKRGLKPLPSLGGDYELVLQLADDEFVTIVEAGPGESATDFKPQNRTRHTNLVATNDFENFTFLTRVRTWEGQQHGRIKHQKLSFSKEQFRSVSGEKNTILQKLNSIEYGSAAAIYDTLYDTRQVVKEFYQQFESLRTELVQKVSGIPDNRGNAKQRYVQVILDRMIFLYFIQEKRLLDRNRDYLHEQPAKVVNEGEDRYKEFYEPLFFEYIAEDNQDPDFGKIPYLNGGLFAKNPVEEEFDDAKLGDSAEETNELFDDILNFLSDWNWNVDERLDIVDPKNLSPAVLGHIFEQTVNQKEMGAYYTPEEITGFMARRTVHPYLLDQLNETLGVSYEEIDDVFGFNDVDISGESMAVADGGMVTRQAPTENVNVGHVETLYHDILKDTKILDPAVGSGAFLLAGQEVLLDLYMQCIEFFQNLEDEGKGWELSSRTRDELDTIASGKGNASLYAKRTIILNNLYGVDIDDGAVEICKLRLWLSMVADIEDEPGEVEPLPNIDFNIRQGNSLIGYVNGLESIINDVDDDGRVQATIGTYGKNSVQQAVEDINKAIQKHKQATSSDKATKWRKDADERISRYRDVFDEKITKEFQQEVDADLTAGQIEQFSPFHWVIEFPSVFRKDGFDITIGNPPWDKIKAERDDYFTNFDEVFRKRGPSDKDSKQEELLENEEIKEGWENYRNKIKIEAEFFKKYTSYKLQSPVVSGKKMASDNDLSSFFLERVFSLTASDGYVAQILPGVTFTGGSKKDLRINLLDNTSMNFLSIFQNKGIFDGIDDRYRFGILVFKNNGSTDNVMGRYTEGDESILKDIEETAVQIPRKILEQYSPEARTFPLIDSQTEVEVLKKYLDYPSMSEKVEDSWWCEPYAELHRTNDRDRFIENRQDADYPVLGGSNIYQFTYNNGYIGANDLPELWSIDENRNPKKSAKHRIREKNHRKLKKGIYEAFDGTGSQKGFVNELLTKHRNEGLSLDDVLLDCTEYRIVYRQIANGANERTIIATVIPDEYVCHNALSTIRPYYINPEQSDLDENPIHGVYDRIFTDEELFAALGILNSIAFDFLIKTKVEENLRVYKFRESQAPRLTKGDEWFDFIWKRAAKLNCYGDEFANMRNRLGGITAISDMDKRKEAQAEIDAAVFHAYGLNNEEVNHILDNFQRVSNPRMMDEEFFEMVSKKYDSLTSNDSL